MIDMVLMLFIDQSCACRQSNCREHDLQCNSGELNLLPVLWDAHQLPEVDDAVDKCDRDFLSHPLVGAFLADAYLGHCYTLTIFSTILLAGKLVFPYLQQLSQRVFVQLPVCNVEKALSYPC